MVGYHITDLGGNWNTFHRERCCLERSNCVETAQIALVTMPGWQQIPTCIYEQQLWPVRNGWDQQGPSFGGTCPSVQLLHDAVGSNRARKHLRAKACHLATEQGWPKNPPTPGNSTYTKGIQRCYWITLSWAAELCKGISFYAGMASELHYFWSHFSQ